MPNLDGIGLSGCLNRRSSTLGDQIRLAKRSTIRSRLQPPNWRMARLVTLPFGGNAWRRHWSNGLILAAATPGDHRADVARRDAYAMQEVAVQILNNVGLSVGRKKRYLSNILI